MTVLDLANFYDSFDVENKWTRNKYVNWISGKISKEKNIKNSYATHCSSFVACVAYNLNLPFLYPDNDNDIGTEGLANKQFDWLEKNGLFNLWIKLKSPLEAQISANCGYFVIAVYKNVKDLNCGHIAIIRPYYNDAYSMEKQVDKFGPRICQAGFINSSSINAVEILGDMNDYVFWCRRCKYTVV